MKVRVKGFFVPNTEDRRDDEKHHVQTYIGKVGEVRWMDADEKHPVLVDFDNHPSGSMRFAHSELEMVK